MVIVLTGPMGCGKTTIGTLLAARLGWRFLDGDDYHPVANIEKMAAGIPLNDEDRYPWLVILHSLIKSRIAEGENVILACSALKKVYRQQLGIDQKDILSIFLDGSIEILAKRIERRTHEFMKDSLLQSQLNTLQRPKTGMIVDINKTPEEIVDEIISLLKRNIFPG